MVRFWLELQIIPTTIGGLESPALCFVPKSLPPLPRVPHLFLFQVDGAQAQIDEVHIRSVLHKADGSLIALLCLAQVPLQVAQVPFLSPDVWILHTQTPE